MLSEILEIKVNLVINLIDKNSISIDRKKHGKKAHRSFISKTGKNLFRKRIDDILFLLTSYGIKLDLDSSKSLSQLNINNYFMFQGKNPSSHLTRETFTNEFNQILSEIPFFKEKNLIIKSHSFRAGYITKL